MSRNTTDTAREIAHDSPVGLNILEVIEAGCEATGVHPGSMTADYIHLVLTGRAKLTGLPETL
jgi:hypothetical protein